MELNRKKFLKQACLSGLCLCGFSVPGTSENGAVQSSISNDNSDEQLIRNWVSNLLKNLEEKQNADLSKTVKKNGLVHFDQLKFDTVLLEYRGNLPKFISFLEEKWGWKIKYDKANNFILADENKNYCVCPVAKGVSISSLLCNCSEGFAELMFSAVIGKPVKAKVVTSVLRGDSSCSYSVHWKV